MIVGTAGHIDHGKTALVRALTGTDADRLPEEKRRGITIELGYAYMPDGADGQIAFVDVPGHEKLVRTMVAGASGIDYALLLIAADDGVMPQTMEHLTILSLLGIRRGAAVITKIDKIAHSENELLRLSIDQAHHLLDDAGLDAYEVLAVSAQNGAGMDELKDLLLREAKRTSLHAGKSSTHDGFRMGLDRVFTLAGIGTVVAGSIAAGSVRIGDSLCLAHAPDAHYRVRSLQVHDAAVDAAHAGQRCAIGLSGLERNAVERGQTLCAPSVAQSSARIDTWLQVAATEASALRSGTLVHLHAGTQECMATVAVLGQPSIAPGESALAQLVMQQSIHAWQGDRFVLRDASASRTIAGGSVLDTAAPARYRQTPERLAYLQTQRSGDPAERLSGALANAPFGLDGKQWLRSAGFAAWPFDPAAQEGVVMDADGWVISAGKLISSQGKVIAALEAFHQKLPEDIGPDLQRARRLAAPRMPESLWAMLAKRMAADGLIGIRSGFMHLPSHGEQLRAADKTVAERALPMLLRGRFDPPWVRDIAADVRLNEHQVRQVLSRLAKTGDVFQVVKDLYYHPSVINELAGIARSIAKRDNEVTASTFRDATGLGRKRAIQILEFFDRTGFLRRIGDVHLLRPSTNMFTEQASAA